MDIEACLAIRRAVFIEEQGVSEEVEMDGLENEGHSCALAARMVGRRPARASLMNGATGKDRSRRPS